MKKLMQLVAAAFLFWLVITLIYKRQGGFPQWWSQMTHSGPTKERESAGSATKDGIQVEVTGPAATAVQFANWTRHGGVLEGEMKYLGPVTVRTGVGAATAMRVKPDYIGYVAYRGNVKVQASGLDYVALKVGETVAVKAFTGTDADRIVVNVDFVPPDQRAALDLLLKTGAPASTDANAAVPANPSAYDPNEVTGASLALAHEMGDAAERISKAKGKEIEDKWRAQGATNDPAWSGHIASITITDPGEGYNDKDGTDKPPVVSLLGGGNPNRDDGVRQVGGTPSFCPDAVAHVKNGRVVSIELRDRYNGEPSGGHGYVTAPVVQIDNPWMGAAPAGPGRRAKAVATISTGADAVSPPRSSAQAPLASSLRSAAPLQAIGGETASIWSGQGGQFSLRWTQADISATREGNAVFSARATAEHDMHGYEPAAEYSRTFALLSVVGSVISFSDTSYCDCGGAHPISEARITTVNFEHPGQPARLTDYFAEADIVRAILADSLVQKAIGAQGKGAKTLKDLVGLSISTKTCSFVVAPDVTTRFAFHHVDKDNVAVRLALSHDVEACRGQMAQLGLLLPIPERLRKPLEAASVGQEGFLMKDAARISGKRSTSLVWKAK